MRPVSCELVGGSKALVRKLYKTGECGSVTDEVIKEGVVIAVVSVTHSNLHSCAEVPASQVEGQPQALQFGGQPQALQFGGQTQALQTMQTQLMSSVAGEWCSLSCVVCVGLSQSAYMRVCVCRAIAWMWSVLLSVQVVQTISCSSEHM